VSDARELAGEGAHEMNIRQATPLPPPEDNELLLYPSEAEQKLLACIMVRNEILPRILSIVGPLDFEGVTHRPIIRAMIRLGEQGTPIEPFTLKEHLIARGELEAAGGANYLNGLLGSVDSAANFEEYARTVKRARAMRDFEELPKKLRNGYSPAQAITLIDRAREAYVKGTGRGISAAADLLQVPPRSPEFTVANFIRKCGLHLIWGQPSAGKTWFLLRWILELLLANTPSHLSGHPELAVNAGYSRVLWIGTEEDAGILRSKVDAVLRGLGDARLEGTLLHRWAPEPGHRLTLEDLPAILEADGPLDAIVLDSLTGLRPKTVNGEKVRWDIDNDAANEMCLMLRGLARQHDVDLFLVHHSGRDVAKGYRGPTDWWASADVQLGLVPERDGGRDQVKVIQEKNRDGRVLKPFLLTREWGPNGFLLTYDGAATAGSSLSPSAKKADAFLRGRTEASQVEIADGAGISRASIGRAVTECTDAGLWRAAGRTKGRSPIYVHTGVSLEGE